MNNIDFNSLEEVSEFDEIIELKGQAEVFLKSHIWCKEIVNSWYQKGIPDKLGIFLFEILGSSQDVDRYIWVVTGDLPSVYLDSSLKNSIEVIDCYCDLMEDWIDAVIKNESLEDCYPVQATPTIEHANMLKARIDFIRKEIIPFFRNDMS